jgi:hypothetical protein
MGNVTQEERQMGSAISPVNVVEGLDRHTHPDRRRLT